MIQMKLIDVGKIGLNGSEIVLGCMRINKVSYKEAEKAVSEIVVSLNRSQI